MLDMAGQRADGGGDSRVDRAAHETLCINEKGRKSRSQRGKVICGCGVGELPIFHMTLEPWCIPGDADLDSQHGSRREHWQCYDTRMDSACRGRIRRARHPPSCTDRLQHAAAQGPPHLRACCWRDGPWTAH